MTIAFYIASIIAILSTVMVISRKNGVHALLYLVVSFLSVSVVFFTLGAPFIAALEIIIYAGAIMVLFIFVVMMLNVNKEKEEQEKKWLKPSVWIGPGILSLILLIEMIILFIPTGGVGLRTQEIVPKEVGTALFSQYVVGVELSAMLLMAGIIGAYHLGKQKSTIVHRFLKEEEDHD